MSIRARVAMFVVIAATVTIGAGTYVAIEVNRASARSDAPPRVAVTRVAAVEGAPRVVFRNTEVGSKYGLVAMASLADPGGARAFTNIACDRVYATPGDAMCLRTKRGIVTTFEAVQLDADWNAVKAWALPGIPSRTRLSADGKLLATTSFVSGHSYMQAGFSTGTEIREASGRDHGNLEKFDLIIDRTVTNRADRNIWGVTFGPGDDEFYATASTGGTTYLVRGSLSSRTLTAMHEGVECPSLSPDGSKVAYKHNTGGATPHWQINVLDLETGRETALGGEARSVDDQVEWLDDETLLYGMARSDEAGVSDVWRIRITPEANATLFIEQAWSPSVVRS